MIKLRELIMILDSHRRDPSVSVIARRISVDRKTVRNILSAA
ncbi:hypothetical protein [Ancylobacter sp. Lp-2]|nr:hypothetical protein [Ancylobacter sp. Lp-2]